MTDSEMFLVTSLILIWVYECLFWRLDSKQQWDVINFVLVKTLFQAMTLAGDDIWHRNANMFFI